MAHDDHSAPSHDDADDAHEHGHKHAHGPGHEPGHGPGHAHGHASGPAIPPRAGTPPDLAKVAILINYWIDHNESHRRTYLEWRDKLTEAGVPATVTALAHIADLTDQATAELRVAAAELQDAGPPRS